ncbi:LysR family transcriptional regulator [Phenylobacterium sp.]|uniref:LysR family transcriptional regulator n=1 Tax=Phenylobacterium sp. TaxID=1871053 RepID=UPI002E370CF7|nr:LysR family transcriptional regulator [Phenylobacterium sp.]HEX4709003.1 LysR family transcriptional regulator [Phenylobacterium sp.]
MTDWQDLHVFAAVARHGSLSAAARELKLDHATVGRRLRSLEGDLAVGLVQRLSRGCRLTAAGAELAGLVAEIETTAHSVTRAAKALSQAVRGDVRLSAPPALASQVLAVQAAHLHRLYPDIRLTLVGETRSVVLGRQEADLAVRLSRPREPDAVARQVGAVAFRPYANATWLARTPAESWTFLGYDEHLEEAAQERALRELAADRPLVFRANDILSLHSACREGMGVAMLPTYMGDDCPELAPVDPTASPLLRPLWIVVHADLRRAAAVKAVADELSAALQRRFPIRPPADLSHHRLAADRVRPVDA